MQSPTSGFVAGAIRRPCPLDRHIPKFAATLYSEPVLSPGSGSSLGDPVVFEPVLNVPAAATFLLIGVVFGALIIRTNQVEEAVQKRKLTLTALRDIKSKELSEGVDESKIQQALDRYEAAVIREERLRNIVPGVVRIVPPSSGDPAEEEARLAAKQFLGKEFDIGTSKREEGNGKIPIVAASVLIILLVSQFVLLVYMNIDAMSTGGSGF